MSSTFGNHRFITILLWSAAGLLALRFALHTAQSATYPTHGFVAYYTASRLLAEGVDARMFYDDAWFAARVQEDAHGVTDYFGNPPSTAWLLRPLVGLGPSGSRIIWTVFNVALLLAALACMVRWSGFNADWSAGMAVVTFGFQPLLANIAWGQSYILILALLVVAWYGLRRGRDGLLAVSLALMLTLKLAGGLLWPLLLAQRRWRALLYAAAALFLIVAGSLPWIRWDAWHAFAQALPRWTSGPSIAATAFQSVPGFFRHLFAFDARWNPAPLLDAPWLAAMLTWIVLLGVIGVSLYIARKGGPRADLAFATFVTAGVVLTPVSQDHHYTLMLLPIAILAARLREQSSLVPWAILLGSILLMGAPLPFLAPRLSEGAAALLAYPRLYGAFLLLGLAVRLSLRMDSNAVNQPSESSSHMAGLGSVEVTV
jgi:hypothetical protein